jgi:hypothetical protein
MKATKKIDTIFQQGSAVFMILALLWLTVSTPFVFASQQYLANQGKIADASTPLSETEEEASNPYSSNTEEKNPTSTSFSEEFLHDHPVTPAFHPETLQYHKGENDATYIAFHGELLVPPPNAA